MGNGHYFHPDCRDNNKVNGFCSIPDKIQGIIHPNSKLRSRPFLEKYLTEMVNFETHVIKSNSRDKTTITNTKFKVHSKCK